MARPRLPQPSVTNPCHMGLVTSGRNPSESLPRRASILTKRPTWTPRRDEEVMSSSSESSSDSDTSDSEVIHVQDENLTPSHLRGLLDRSTYFLIPNKQARLTRKHIMRLLGGSMQASWVKLNKNRLTPLAKEFGITHGYYAWQEHGEPLFPSGPGKHGAAITFALHLADGTIIHENGPASVHRDQPMTESVTFMRRKRGEWQYMGTYRHGIGYEQLTSLELAALKTDDKFWWAKAFWPVQSLRRTQTWGFNMFLDAGLVRNEKSFRKQYTIGRLFDMMFRPDLETGACVAFYWRYMECTGYNTHFYTRLMELAASTDYQSIPDQTVDSDYNKELEKEKKQEWYGDEIDTDDEWKDADSPFPLPDQEKSQSAGILSQRLCD
ncbi:MAG: hypothetical protein M1814_001708 [Vezdaea aestivalis]|nr:MAG: hypothetical protein M1814_001708 [Vezdaea aestivalis]